MGPVVFRPNRHFRAAVSRVAVHGPGHCGMRPHPPPTPVDGPSPTRGAGAGCRADEWALMASVTFEHVAKVYDGGVRAVNDLNLDIADGEFMVLVGPSGCGKTTALRMLAGLETISEGAVRIGERVVNYVPSRDRDIAMVFQSYALYPHLSVYENIAFGLRVKKVPKAEIDQRVKTAANTLGLEPLLQRKPRALSGGQRQRVAMGRALVRDPQAFPRG